MKIIEPAPFLARAAEVVEPFAEDVVLIGAAALQVVLAPEAQIDLDDPPEKARNLVIMTPTRDVDLAVDAHRVSLVVAQIEKAGLRPSSEPHERGFTWVLDDVKLQLVMPFHPFPDEVARGLPQNASLSLLANEKHRMNVAFANEPDRVRFSSATPAALVALKENAFGRTRHDGSSVERDYHDVFLIVANQADALEATYRDADYHVRRRVDRALEVLGAGGVPTEAAARQHAQVNGGDIQEHEFEIARAATFLHRRLIS